MKLDIVDLESESFYNEAPGHFFHFKLFINLKNIILFLILKILIKKIKNDIFKSTKKTFFFEEIVDIYILSYLQN